MLMLCQILLRAEAALSCGCAHSPITELSSTVTFCTSWLSLFFTWKCIDLIIKSNEHILKTTLTIKQDYSKTTINWGTIQVLENNFYAKVSHIRRLTAVLKSQSDLWCTSYLSMQHDFFPGFSILLSFMLLSCIIHLYILLGVRRSGEGNF